MKSTKLFWALLSLVFPIFVITASPFASPVGIVVLDAGHGGHDPGAIAEGSLQEKEIVLDLTLRVGQHLRRQDPNLSVILTRETDEFIPLEERANIATQLDPGIGKTTIFVSIHVNSSHFRSASGFEVLLKERDKWVRFLDSNATDWEIARYANYTAGDVNKFLNRENVLLATAMVEEIRKSFPTMPNRGIKEQNLWILHASKVPTILVEVGFLSNAEEAYNMTQESWRSAMANAIAEGILRYITRY
ncbi:MAG: N-acetylmuramoyl-L-alanine amidase [Sphaerochaetaceae bacterium]|nr:N-acetylmuramoyl-L-alanine amidase [Sphaerochaetaceae bacterium]MDD4218559.1 N-acetylmuramoyl-L-alanine amidase [Sphaerochaetaceae bacterium]MDY0371401.1 N-acetylmuramoyl-L-alanine amidase [Sphaerochaetaceae bacterium]